jgi:hypothetical protein
MTVRAPTVWEDHSTGGARLEAGPWLDTPAWLAWLEAPSTTSFSYPVADPQHGYIAGFLTVRKERRQRGGSYWTAYWRRGGHLCKAYLGPAAAVTTGRLRTLSAAWLAAPPVPAAL